MLSHPACCVTLCSSNTCACLCSGPLLGKRNERSLNLGGGEAPRREAAFSSPLLSLLPPLPPPHPHSSSSLLSSLSRFCLSSPWAPQVGVGEEAALDWRMEGSRQDRARDCAWCLAAAGMQGGGQIRHGLLGQSHFRASGSWHRMLWPENLTTQECYVQMSSFCAGLTSGWELPVLVLRTGAPPPPPYNLKTCSPSALHTGSLVPLWGVLVFLRTQ